MKKTFLLMIFLIGLTEHVFSAESGTTGATFLTLGVGAKPSGLGEAYSGIPGDVNSIYYNPAGLGWLIGTEVTAMHSEWFQGIRYEHFGWAQEFKEKGTFGASLTGLYLGEMEKRTGPTAQPLGTFGAYSLQGGVSYGKRFREKFSIGGTVKGIYQKIDIDKGTTGALDFGATYSPVKNLFIATSISDLGPSMKFLRQSSALPTRGTIGAGYVGLNGALSIALDGVIPVSDEPGVRGGIEYVLQKILAIRVGYQTGREDLGSFSGISGGAGFYFKGIKLDYALARYGFLGDTHRISLTYGFGKPQEEKPGVVADVTKQRMTSDLFYKDGLEQMKVGKYEEAVAFFDRALLWDPDNSLADLKLKEAKRLLREKEIKEHFKAGIMEFNAGNFLGAIEHWNGVLMLDPGNIDAKRRIEEAQKKRKEQEAKIASGLREKISQLMEAGIRLFSQGDLRGAIVEWEKVLSLDPSSIEARDYIQRVKIKIIEEVKGYMDRATSFFSQGKYELAVSEYSKALKLDPDNAEAKSGVSKARARISSAIMEHLETARQFYAQKKYLQAEEEVQIVLRAQPKNASALDLLSKIKEKGKTGKKGDVQELYLKGISSYTKNDYESAIFYWEKCLAIDPSFVNAQKNIERAKVKLAELKK